jgi:hypothetical protein
MSPDQKHLLLAAAGGAVLPPGKSSQANFSPRSRIADVT